MSTESVQSVSRYKKLLTTQVVSHFIQHKTFSALNYAQDFGNRMMESLKRTTIRTRVRARVRVRVKG